MKSVANIVKSLENAHTWLDSAAKWSVDSQDRVKRLVIACVYLLSQSPRSYRQWLQRSDRVKKIRGKWTTPANNKALRDLVLLTISDVEAGCHVPLAPWQLDEWQGGSRVCGACGEVFTAKRKSAKTCSVACRVTLSRE